MSRTSGFLLKLFFTFLCAIAGAGVARAQAITPLAEISGGYSLLPANGDDFPRVTSHGLTAGAAFNINNWFGVVGEFSQQWSSSSDLGPNFQGLTANTTVREFLVGPRFTARGDRANVFAHGWLGRAVGDAGDNFSGFSDSGLALGGGGGVDVRLAPRAAWRIQFEYLGSFADIVDNNTRFQTGVVVSLGRR